MILSTKEAFSKFKSRLELSDTEQKDASKRQKDVRSVIENDFKLKTSFLTGSYGRNTKTKPLKDVDIFFVLADSERERRDKHPAETLDAFKKTLVAEYGQDKVDVDHENRRCVTVEFESAAPTVAEDGKVLSVDAVPAFECGNAYEIPDRDKGEWIKTDPTVHKRKATDKNESLHGNWVPLVKMIKAWNRANGKPIKPSFLIEVMALELVVSPFTSYQSEIRRFFAAALQSIDNVWPDPAGFGPPVSDQMIGQRLIDAKQILRDAEMTAALASKQEQQGRQTESLKTWRALLGDYFPLS